MGANDLAHLMLIEIGAVLSGDDDGRGAHRLAVLVLQGDLALGVGTEAGFGA